MQSPFTPAAAGGAALSHWPARRPVRVLHCIPTLSVGGAETQLRLLAPRLVAQGIGVGIFGRLAPDDVQALERSGVTCFPAGGWGNHDPRIAAALVRAVWAMRPTVIQTWLTQMDILGGLVARTCGVPWIVAERSSPMAYSSSLKNRLRQQLGRHAVLVANGPQGLDVWPGHADAQVIGNGIDLAAIAVAPRDLMRDVVPFRGRTTAVTVSRLVPEKNVDVLIEAIAIARRSLPNIRLIVVGDGPERARLESMVADRGLLDDVAFVGFRSLPVEWVRSADMFASASLFEGHPNAVTEAAAAGVPAVLSDIPMHRSLMGDAARYASVGDADAFAAQILVLARDATVRDAIAAAGRRMVERFDIDAIASLYARLYERLTPVEVAG